MSNTVFQIRRNSVSGVRPTTSSIQSGELALNLTDGVAFSTNGTVVFELGANNTNVNVTGNATIKAIIANGSIGSANQVLTSNGSGIYWTIAGPSNINTAAQYTWTNTHTFQSNVAFTGNNISVVSNTGSILFNGASDGNWRIGRNTGLFTKYYYTNNSLDIIAASSPLEGAAFGISGNSYLETGYAGTFTRLSLYVGNATVNSVFSNTASITINNSNTATLNASSLAVGNASVNAVYGLSTLTFNGATIANTTGANNAFNLNNQSASYYTNASNITTGTLPWAQAPTNTVNTSGAFTISGVYTHTANIVANSNLMLVNSVALMSNTYTFTNSSVAANVDLVSTSTYRSFEYTIQLADTTLATPSHHITKILIVHNGTTTYMTEYGTVFSSINLGTFTSGISAGNLYLQLTPNSANVVCKFMRTAIAI